MMNIMNPPADWSTLKKLIWLRGTPINGGEELAVSGTPPLSLPNSLGKPLKAWSVDVMPYQEGTGDPAPDNVRPIHGTDKVTVWTDSKYGGLVEWNQLVLDGNFPNATNWRKYNSSSGDISVSGNVLTLELIEGGQSEAVNVNNPIKSVPYHRYLYSVDVKSASWASTGYKLLLRFAGYWAKLISSSESLATDTWITIAGINDGVQAEDILAPSVRKYNDTGLNPLYVRNYVIFDLTQMFGAGNEPSTVEEFRALFPKPYYPYNAGQTMTVDQVNGSSYTPAVLTLPQTVYTGTIGSEGGESRWGEVDLGTVSWTYRSSLQSFSFYPQLAPQAPANYLTVPKIMCEQYKPVSISTSTSGDYCCTVGREQYFNGSIIVKDTRYTDVTLFKNAMSGVKLVYELATPTQFPLTAPTIPTPTGTATTWATAEDGTVESMDVTYVGKA